MAEEEDFAVISKTIIKHLNDNECDVAIDRLHTFMVKYSRSLCTQNKLVYNKDEPLNALFGKYVRHLRDNVVIDSEITYKILGSSVQILDKFNNVRNTQSLAHDNLLLNYQESLLIFNNISSLINFVNFIEDKNK